MNKERRKQISTLIEKLEALQSDVEFVLEDEQEYMGNIPENLQGSERYEMAEEAVGNLEDALDSLGDLLASLEKAIE